MPKPRIIYDIGFNVDGTGLQRVRQEFKDIKNMSFKDAKLINADLTIKEFNEIQSEAKKLESILKTELVGTIPDSDNILLNKGGSLPSNSTAQKAYKLLAKNTVLLIYLCYNQVCKAKCQSRLAKH